MATRWGFTILITFSDCLYHFNLPFVVWIMRSFLRTYLVTLKKQPWWMDTPGGMLLEGHFTSQCSGFSNYCNTLFHLFLNEFLFANVLTAAMAKTVPVGIRGLVTSRAIEWGEIAAVAPYRLFPF